jgi:hypothetical protein
VETIKNKLKETLHIITLLFAIFTTILVPAGFIYTIITISSNAVVGVFNAERFFISVLVAGFLAIITVPFWGDAVPLEQIWDGKKN